MANLSDLIAEEEAKRIAEARAEIAAEKAAWDALTPEQQAAETAGRNRRCRSVSPLPLRRGRLLDRASAKPSHITYSPIAPAAHMAAMATRRSISGSPDVAFSMRSAIVPSTSSRVAPTINSSTRLSSTAGGSW